MTLTGATAPGTDASSRSRLDRLFRLQNAAFDRQPNPSLDVRLARLKRLETMMLEARDPIRDSLREDFGSHPAFLTDLLETAAVIGRSRFFQRNLADWMQPADVRLNPGVYGAATSAVHRQPKGVMGNIGPWNFPIECLLVMVNDMFAGGNSVIVKPSEHAPATAALLERLVPNYFDEETLAVVTGGQELAEYFATLPWDHLTFTGTARVGRLVMAAAAQNLVPVTLELGGKNPTVFAADGIDRELMRLFLAYRVLKAGQVCTSPDYALVPRGQVDDFVALASSVWAEMYPSYVGHADATAIINKGQYDRIMGYVHEAQGAGVQVVSLNGDEPDPETRQIPMYMIVEPGETLACMREEIFGPVTPVVAYDSVDDALSRINDGPAPLASYLATHDSDLTERFVARVRSGGSAINTFGAQGAHPALPFGGVGRSGTGYHAGFEGFLNYTHSKPVFYGSDDSVLQSSMTPPYTDSGQRVVDAIFGSSS